MTGPHTAVYFGLCANYSIRAYRGKGTCLSHASRPAFVSSISSPMPSSEMGTTAPLTLHLGYFILVTIYQYAGYWIRDRPTGLPQIRLQFELLCP